MPPRPAARFGGAGCAPRPAVPRLRRAAGAIGSGGSLAPAVRRAPGPARRLRRRRGGWSWLSRWSCGRSVGAPGRIRTCVSRFRRPVPMSTRSLGLANIAISPPAPARNATGSCARARRRIRVTFPDCTWGRLHRSSHRDLPPIMQPGDLRRPRSRTRAAVLPRPFRGARSCVCSEETLCEHTGALRDQPGASMTLRSPTPPIVTTSIVKASPAVVPPPGA